MPRLRPRRDPPRAVAAPRGARRRLRAVARDPRRLLRPAVERRDLGLRRPPPAGPGDVAAEPPPRRHRDRRRARAPGTARPGGARPLAEPAPSAAARPAARPARAAEAVREPRLRFLSLADRYVLARFGAAFSRPGLRGPALARRRLCRQARRGRPPPSLRRGGLRLLPLLPAFDHDPDRAVRGPAGDARRPRDAFPEQRGHGVPGLGPLAVAALRPGPRRRPGSGRCSPSRSASTCSPSPSSARRASATRSTAVPPDAGGRGPGVSNWYLSENDEIWHREDADAGSQELFGVSVFTFDKQFRLVRRTAARDAVWTDGAWKFRNGWTRGFDKRRASPTAPSPR